MNLLKTYDWIIALYRKHRDYESIIHPYSAHSVTVEDFMLRRLKTLTMQSTYWDAYELLQRHTFRAFPVVDSNGKKNFRIKISQE